MKGDFSRFSFKPEKQFTRVLKQQGRVDLDADWNEANAIHAYLDRVHDIDVIGRCGVPKENAGFGVTPAADGGDLDLSDGRLYANGQLVAIAGESYLNQPYLPAPPALEPADTRRDLVYTAVWQRHITAVEDPDLLEIALGGADTTTRLQTVWQVRVRRDVGTDDCEAIENWPPLPPLRQRGRLTTGTTVVIDEGDPCLIAPGGGYRGLENRLYRVEIHDGGAPYTWPRPGTVQATAVNAVDEREIELADWDGWAAGQMVELFSDETDGGGTAGTLARVTAVDAGSSRLTLDTDVSGMAGHTNLMARRVATYKWSRDNGAVAFPIQEFISGEPTKVRVKRLGKDQVLTLHTSDWVEVLGDETELRFRPGTLTNIVPNGIDEADMILTLGTDVSGHDGETAPKVRRWDMAGPPLPVQSGILDLEDGVQIQFGGDTFLSGDYWSFAARTATGSVEALSDAPPLGIDVAFCKLGIVRWRFDPAAEDWSPSTVTDCRPTFPALTEICAEDVCYDNENCDSIQAQTVQEAIDQLCAQRDLRHHNKHLHGWGIVCGLQVHCGPDDPQVPGDRNAVTVRPGYALDCEGNDIVLDEDLMVDVLELIREWEEAHPDDPPLIVEGRGDVCLIVERDERGQARVALRPYDPAANDWQNLFKGTLLMDFYEDCILGLIEAIRELLNPENGDGRQLVGVGRRQTIALLNLIIQFVNPQFGSHVYLSQKEHNILQMLYFALREILQSKTFCAMFDDARPFPEYPFGEDVQMSTIFDLRPQVRMRVHPDGRLGYGLGYDDNIHVYDLEAEELILVLPMPGGRGLLARDVAFSEDGRQLYAIATLPQGDTIFAIADIDGDDHQWRPMEIVCDGMMLTLLRRPGRSNTLLATGQGRGLFIIDDPENIRANADPAAAFNAVGQLTVDESGQFAYATAAAEGEDPTLYDHVLRIDLDNPDDQFPYHLEAEDQQWHGQDDIALVSEPQGDLSKLYVVAEPVDNGQKHLLVFDTSDPDAQNLVPLGATDTIISLAYVPGEPTLIVGYEDFYWARLVDVNDDFLLEEYHLPLQISPVDIVIDPQGEWGYFVNGISTTITRVNVAHLRPIDQQPGNVPPGGQAFLEVLRQYRQDIIAAFLDLAGGLMQYLKDCFCDHLLVSCPECDEEDELYLGCVSIREGEVYKVCNFSRRKYVKSFPTVGYWLSLIPIAPLIDVAVERFCCLVLPDLFGRVNVPDQGSQRTAPVRGYQVRGAYMAYNQGILQRSVRSVASSATLARGLSLDWAGERLNRVATRPFVPPTTGLRQRDLVNQPVSDVQRRAAAANVTVAGVERYDASLGLRNLRHLSTLPGRLEPGEEIKLYERDGKVRYYSVVKAEPAEGAAVTEARETAVAATAEVEALRDQVASMEAELAELRTFRDEVRTFMDRNG